VLILWRSSGQTMTVGEGVEIQVLDTRHNRVKLGIVAPDSVSIVRGEARITREENRAAALSAGRGVIETLLRRLPQDATHPKREAPDTRRQEVDSLNSRASQIKPKNLRTFVAPPDMEQ
jgi:carbon storage regulator CsrA